VGDTVLLQVIRYVDALKNGGNYMYHRLKHLRTLQFYPHPGGVFVPYDVTTDYSPTEHEAAGLCTAHALFTVTDS